MRCISLRHHWQTTKERSREAEGIRPEKIEDKITHNFFADLQLLVDAMVEAVVLVIIFALVQRIVLHMFGQSGLHLVYVYPCWRHLWCIVNQCGVTYVVWLCWYRFQSWWTDFWRESVSLFCRLFILPDTFCLIYAIPEEDADAFRGIKSQGGNLTLCFCGWEVQAETTAVRIVRFLCLNKLSTCEEKNMYPPEFGREGICMGLTCRHTRKKCRQPNWSPSNQWQHDQQWSSGFPKAQADLPGHDPPNQWRFQWRRLFPDNSRRGSSSLC